MLQTLRKSVGSFVIKILFGLLVLSFAVWGIGDTFFFGGASNTVAEVGIVVDPRKPFLRAVATTSGATAGGTVGVLFLLGTPGQEPVIR